MSIAEVRARLLGREVVQIDRQIQLFRRVHVRLSVVPWSWDKVEEGKGELNGANNLVKGTISRKKNSYRRLNILSLE